MYEGKFIDKLMTGEIVDNLNGAKVVDLITTATITGAQSGKLFTLSLAGGFTVTLPAPAAGLEYRFVVKIAPTTAYIIASAGSGNKIYGTIASGDLDATADTGAAQASDTISFAANKALIGDSVDLISDGTYWYARGFCKAVDALTLTQAT